MQCTSYLHVFSVLDIDSAHKTSVYFVVPTLLYNIDVQMIVLVNYLTCFKVRFWEVFWQGYRVHMMIIFLNILWHILYRDIRYQTVKFLQSTNSGLQKQIQSVRVVYLALTIIPM